MNTILETVETTQISPEGFFTLAKLGERWILLTPERQPFFSVGLNHIDSSPLRYPENLTRWKQKYDNNSIKWICESVSPDLKAWGFNTVGWVQDVTILKHAHSPSFTLEEYRALSMPYCHLLPFIETHQWNAWHKNPTSSAKTSRTGAIMLPGPNARDCRDEPNLNRLFLFGLSNLGSRPNSHIRHRRGPMFDPARLESQAGRTELFNLAQRYYKITHDAIRRYDPHHLILGDRYEALAPLPMEIVQAADPYVDVLSFQDFGDPVTHMHEWHAATGKPVLWADGSRPRETITDDSGKYLDGEYHLVDGEWYAEALYGLLENPGAIGAHLCGGYLRNRFRRKGLIDEKEQPDHEAISEIQKGSQVVAR